MLWDGQGRHMPVQEQHVSCKHGQWGQLRTFIVGSVTSKQPLGIGAL